MLQTYMLNFAELYSWACGFLDVLGLLPMAVIYPLSSFINYIFGDQLAVK